MLLTPASSCIGQSFRVHDPPAAHRLVQVYERREDGALRLDIRKLDVEQASFRVEHLDVARKAAFVAQPRETRVAAQRVDLPRLRGELLAELLVGYERVLDFAE